jgi:hypothetical protein
VVLLKLLCQSCCLFFDGVKRRWSVFCQTRHHAFRNTIKNSNSNSTSTVHESKMSSLAAGDRGTIAHRTSFGWLQILLLHFKQGLQGNKCSTRLTRPSVKVLSGTMIVPFPSTAFAIVKVASIETIAIQRLLSARYWPVQTLCNPRYINHNVRREQNQTNLRPKPNEMSLKWGSPAPAGLGR